VVSALLVLLIGRPSSAAEAVPLDEHTALVLGRHRLKLGVLAFERGITHNVSVGLNAAARVAGGSSIPPAWRRCH
jgi:hypothetical protein